VLDSGVTIQTGLMFMHIATRGTSGGVSLLMINTDRTHRTSLTYPRLRSVIRWMRRACGNNRTTERPCVATQRPLCTALIKGRSDKSRHSDIRASDNYLSRHSRRSEQCLSMK